MDTVGCKTLGWCFDRRFTRFVPYLNSFLFDPHFAHLFWILIKSKPECKEQMVSLLFKASLSGKVAVRDLKDFSKLHPAYEFTSNAEMFPKTPSSQKTMCYFIRTDSAWLGITQPQHHHCDEVPKSKTYRETFCSKPHLLRNTMMFSKS